METLKSNMVARWDTTFSGLVPVKVLSIKGASGVVSTNQTVTAIVTKDHGIYKKGERVTCSALWIAPVKAVHYRKYGTTISRFLVSCDEEVPAQACSLTW